MTAPAAPSARYRAVLLVAASALALGVATALMLLVRGRLDKAHVTLIYLVVVLGGSAASGRRVGLSLAGAAFLLFNYFFLPPYNTLVIADPLDWLVLVAFLVTSAVAAELLHRQRRQASIAAARADELDQIATLGAETLNAPRAEQALAAIATVIARTVGAERCQLFVRDAAEPGLRCVADTGGGGGGADTPPTDPSGLLEYIVRTGRSAIERDDGTIRVAGAEPGGPRDPAEPGAGSIASARAFAAPLSVRGASVGAIRVSGPRGLELTADQRRVLGALSYYAALGIERLKLEGVGEAAEQLRRADRLKDALVAAVSHDLRTPLTTIKAIAHEIAAGGQGRAAVIEDEADRMSSLVEGLLELSQLDAGALRLNREINTLDDLVGAALQRAQSVLHDHRVDVTFAGDGLVTGVFDFSQALRALTNILENAAKYSPPGAPIGVRVAGNGADVEVTVSDRGPGVPVAERDRVFEPFYRIPGVAPDVRGAGLGLSIARRFARAQGGDLVVADAPGGGAAFTLRLPAHAEQTA